MLQARCKQDVGQGYYGKLWHLWYFLASYRLIYAKRPTVTFEACHGFCLVPFSLGYYFILGLVLSTLIFDRSKGGRRMRGKRERVWEGGKNREGGLEGGLECPKADFGGSPLGSI